MARCQIQAGAQLALDMGVCIPKLCGTLTLTGAHTHTNLRLSMTLLQGESIKPTYQSSCIGRCNTSISTLSPAAENGTASPPVPPSVQTRSWKKMQTFHRTAAFLCVWTMQKYQCKKNREKSKSLLIPNFPPKSASAGLPSVLARCTLTRLHTKSQTPHLRLISWLH